MLKLCLGQNRLSLKFYFHPRKKVTTVESCNCPLGQRRLFKIVKIPAKQKKGSDRQCQDNSPNDISTNDILPKSSPNDIWGNDICLTTFGQMTFCQMAFSQMTISQMTFCQKTFCPMTFCKTTFCQMTFCPMTFCETTFCPMTFCQTTFCK